MTGRIHIYLSAGTAAVVASFLLLTIYAVFLPPMLKASGARTAFTSEPIRGVSVVVKGKAFLLNFNQQQHVLAHLHRSVVFDGASMETEGISLPIEKIVFHRFEGTDIEVEPLAWREQKMIFRSPNSEQTLIDSSEGHLFSLLATTYD